MAAVFKDITERKLREQRQDYLLKLSDSLRSTIDPVAVEEMITHLILDQFGADRC